MERKWWTLAIVVTAIFMLLIDITVVNVALPQIEKSLGASFSELQWVIDAYSLALATFVLNAGALADLVGRRKVFVAGVTLFTASSTACGLASTPLFLIVCRGVQGIGGAVMFATSLAIIAQAFTGAERGIAFGVWGATAGAAVAIGPLVGGVLTTGIGWEWIFFVNGPIGIAAIAGALLRMDESRDPGASRLDWQGLVTLSGGLSLLVYALLRGEDHGWRSLFTLSCFAGAAVLLVLFVVTQVRQKRPMVDLSLFRRPAFAGAQLTAFLLSLSFFGLFLYLTLYLQNVLGYSALGAGIRLLPVSVASFAVAPLAGRLSAKVPVRLLMGGGLALVGGGLVLMAGLGSASSWTALVPGFALVGIGIGLTNPPLASTAVSVAPRDRSGMASGVNNTFRQVGIATGVAALGAVFQSRIRSHLVEALQGTPAAAHTGQLARAASSGAIGRALEHVPVQAREQVAAAARSSFVASLDTLFWISAVIAFAGAVAALVLVRDSDLDSGEEVADEPTTREARVREVEPTRRGSDVDLEPRGAESGSS
jgi:EmrB/QacA subfamily drug resistance transporter